MPFDFVKFAFSAGELSPELHGRGDLEGFRAGFRDGSNVVVDWRGGVRDRPGTRMAEPLFLESSIAERVRLSTFSFNTDPEDNYLLIWRNRSLMIVQDGGYLAKATPRQNGSAMTFPVGTIVLVHGADVDGDIGPYLFTGRVRSASTVDVPWKDDTITLTTERVIAAYRNNDSPYAHADLRALNFAQFRDELLITHNSYAPYLLRRTLDGEGFPVFTFERIAFLDARGVQNKRAAIADRAVEFDSREGGIQWTVAVVDEEGKEYPVDELDAVTTANVDIGKKILNLHWTADPIAARYRIYASAFKARFDELTTGGPTNTVNPDGTEKSSSPTFPNIPAYTGKAGEIFDQVLPAATGGDGTISYSAAVDRSIYTFDPVSRRLTGSPTAHGVVTFTYSATDESGTVTNTQVTINVAEADENPSAATLTITSIDTSIQGHVIYLRPSHNLDDTKVPDNGDFVVTATDVNGPRNIPISGLGILRNNRFDVGLESPRASYFYVVTENDTITISYTPNSDPNKRIQGAAAEIGELAAFTDRAVINDVDASRRANQYPPTVLAATLQAPGTELILHFDQLLNTQWNFEGRRFVVGYREAGASVFGDVNTIAGVITGQILTLTLDTTIAVGDFLTMRYQGKRVSFRTQPPFSLLRGTGPPNVPFGVDNFTVNVAISAGAAEIFEGIIANDQSTALVPTWALFDVAVGPSPLIDNTQKLKIGVIHARSTYPEPKTLTEDEFTSAVSLWEMNSGATRASPIASSGPSEYAIEDPGFARNVQFFTGDSNNYWTLYARIVKTDMSEGNIFFIGQVRGGGFGVRT